MLHRVVITGTGTFNPLGHTLAETWDKMITGVSGVGPLTLFDTSAFAVKIACEVKNFDPTRYMDSKEARRRDRYQQLGAAAAQLALADSGLVITEQNAGRIAVIVSSSIGGSKAFEDGVRALLEGGPRRISPMMIPMLMPNGASGLIGIDTGAKGPTYSVASACASGADAIGNAWLLIRYGLADAALTGASEAPLTATGVGAFDRLGALSHQNEDYSMTPQPFDKNRDGLVMGEGAAVLVLEALEHAQARGAAILAEVAGYAATADAHHITAPDAHGSGGAAAMLQALASAGLTIAEVDYINAHGTGTSLNDSAETAAIKRAFGPRAYQIPISSTKSMTGHMMGATGALEALVCAQVVRTQVIPPTLHYQTPDPDCDLDYVPNTARAAEVKVAISNAFGFGGHNAVLVIKRFMD